MAPFVFLAIIVDKLGGAFALRNDRLDPSLCQTRAQRLGVKGLVAEEGFAVDTLQKIISSSNFGPFSDFFCVMAALILGHGFVSGAGPGGWWLSGSEGSHEGGP